MVTEGGSAKKRIKTSKRNTLKNYPLNALFMISIKGPQLATLEAKELIKHTARIHRERKQHKSLVLNKKSKRHKLIQNTIK